MSYALSTVDNPYNPFTQFDEWYGWDEAHGYHSCALLGRIVRTSDSLSDADNSNAIESAIEEIVNENVSGMHIKVPDPTQSSDQASA